MVKVGTLVSHVDVGPLEQPLGLRFLLPPHRQLQFLFDGLNGPGVGATLGNLETMIAAYAPARSSILFTQERHSGKFGVEDWTSPRNYGTADPP